MSKFIFVFVMLVGLNAMASSKVDVHHDRNACYDGWISTDVEVKVDQETFKFRPSCSFSFKETFKTKAGVKCEVSAGMCSSNAAASKLAVRCQGGGADAVNITCPKKRFALR